MVNIQRAATNKNIVNKNTVLTDDRAQKSLSRLPRIQQNLSPARDANESEQILCYYTNTTRQIQIIRSVNIAKYCFERVVFPGQRLLFEAMPEAQIEIHTGTMATAILSDRIPCSRLRVHAD
jgi:Domain of unknown function (DUF1830)